MSAPFFHENLFLPKLLAKMLSGNQIAGFFKMKYRKKQLKDEIYFGHADKYESLLQVDIIIFKAYPNHSKQQVCYLFAIF